MSERGLPASFDDDRARDWREEEPRRLPDHTFVVRCAEVMDDGSEVPIITETVEETDAWAAVEALGEKYRRVREDDE